MMIIFTIRATRLDDSASRGVNALKSSHARLIIACLSYVSSRSINFAVDWRCHGIASPDH